MKRKNLTLIVLGLVLTSCGLLERFKTPEDQNASSENIPSSEMASSEVSTPSPDDEFNIFVDKPETTVAAAETAPPLPQDYLQDVNPEVKAMPEVSVEPVVADMSEKKIKIYKVKKGETLMQIAFKLYGDIGRWQDLKKLNQEKVSRNTKLAENLTLKYEAPETEFVWNPTGVPYLINHGETLGVISNNVYQTPKKWKALWENNKPLIKNPNVIYAGFTLYYIKDTQLANYVQPKRMQKKKLGAVMPAAPIVEKIEVANELMKVDQAETETATRMPASLENPKF